MKKWSEKEFNEALMLLKQGCNYYEIAEILQRSRDSVKNKLYRCNMNYTKHNNHRKNITCVTCKKIINVIKASEQKFCSQSCAASHNNKLRGRKIEKICLNCDTRLKRTQKKYCSNKCQGAFEKKERYKKIEQGDTTLNHRIYKAYLIKKYGEKCMECGWCEKNNFSGKIPIELEHIDGDSKNNSLDNLKLLCPNCHSLTPTYKALNAGNGRYNRMKRYRSGKSY